LGVNDGSARLDVMVDGEITVVNAPTLASGQFEQAYTLRGLPYGEHTVTLEVTAGELNVDAVGVVEVAPEQPAPADAVAEALTVAEGVERTEEFTDAAWQALQHAIADAQAAVADPAGYRLDGEGARALVERLAAGSAPLAGQIVSVEDVRVATEVGEQPELPENVSVTLTDETTREIAVDWPTESLDLSQGWATEQVVASYGSVDITATVEVVPPSVVAFADINGVASAELGEDSPAYLAIAAHVQAAGGELVNDSPDQVLDDTWGHWGENGSGAEEIHYKGPVTGEYDKLTTTGMYTANGEGSERSYTFPLPAGEYTLAAGSHSWWPAYSRTADVVLSYDGEDHVVDTVTLDQSSPSALLSYDLQLAEDGPVTLTLVNTSDQSPMLSWVGVSSAEETQVPGPAAGVQARGVLVG